MSLVYNYDFESIEEEEEFIILSPSTPPNSTAPFRKYSEGLEPMEAFTLKPQQINKDAISKLKEKANKLKFITSNTQTIK